MMLGVRNVRTKKGINQVLTVALLIAMAVVVSAALFSYTTGFVPTKKTPVAQFAIDDHPDVVGPGNKAFIIRHLGGDRINFNDLILAVYDANRNLIYNKDVATANGTDVIVNQLSSPGYDNNFFEGGEQIIANCSGVGVTTAGTYEIVLYYKPTMQPLVDRHVSIT